MAVQAYGKRARAGDRLGRRRSAAPPAAAWRCGWSRAPIGTARSSARRSRGCPTIRCSPARRRPTSRISPARATCSRRRNIYPAFASHNALTVATILEWAGQAARDFEFQRLHGMGDGLYERLVQDEGYHCRIYAPVGGHRDLLAYLVRRLLENGANSSLRPPAGRREADRRRDPRRSGREDRGGGRHAPSLASRCRSICSAPIATQQRRASTCSDRETLAAMVTPRSAVADAGARGSRVVAPVDGGRPLGR